MNFLNGIMGNMEVGFCIGWSVATVFWVFIIPEWRTYRSACTGDCNQGRNCNCR